jgi:asparagine N-glycosylation enzyme membrane subunit Stt3
MGASRRWTVIASGLLLLALALVVIYTQRTAFRSPIALVVVSAIGVAALLLQLRFRHDLPGLQSSFWTVVGTLASLFAIGAEYWKIPQRAVELASFVAVGCFGISGALLLHALRLGNTQPRAPSSE